MRAYLVCVRNIFICGFLRIYYLHTYIYTQSHALYNKGLKTRPKLCKHNLVSFVVLMCLPT
jgi:hypothetical protein